MANVFISHSSADNDWAEKIHVWLEEIGHDVFLDRDQHDGIVVGDDWERRLYERLRWADAVVCIVTAPYIQSVWCAAEIGAARALGIELLPVRINPGDERHTLLKTLQGVDAAVDPEVAREHLRSRLTVIDGGGGWGWHDGKSPYPGLRPFELGEHRVFFGRNREITSITKRLRSSERAQSAVLTVVGPSGCGKSSLIRAGVLPRIAGENYWLSLPPIVPGTDPLGGLIRAIAAFTRERQIPFDVTTLREDIERDGLKDVATDLLLAAGADSQCKLLIVVDQFEELLTQTDPADRAKFVAALVPALGGPIQVLATLRPEYLDPMAKDPDLMKLALRMHQVRSLDSDALREVIEQPAKVAGLTFEDDLVSRLITDTGSGDALPLLAFTLSQLAQGLGRGGLLTHGRYEDIGGVQGALQRQADDALEAACGATGMTRNQVITELLNLVTIDDQGRPSRRRLVFDGSSEREQCLKPFLEERLLSTEAEGKTPLITVAHDSFLVNWPPLKEEIDAKVIALRARRSVETAARDWEANGRDAAVLLQGGQLAKAIVDTGADFEPVREVDRDDHLRRLKAPRWRERRRLTTRRVDLDDSARDFLEASADADRAKKASAKKKTVSVVALLSVITLVAVVGAIWAGHQQGRAEQSEREAIAQRLIADARVKLSTSVEAAPLQELLAGRSLTRVSDDTLYRIVVGSASTFKIMENPPRPDGEGLVSVQTVAVSPDGKLIASGSNDHKLRLWDAESGALDRTIDLAGNRTVWSVAFNPDGTRIAVGSGDSAHGILQVVDTQSGEPVGTLMQHPALVGSTAFNHNGQLIATGDASGTVRVWDLVTGKPVAEMPADVPGSARSVAFHPTSDIVASANGYKVRLWDTSGRKLEEWSDAGNLVRSVAFDRAGDRLAVGIMGGNVRLLDAQHLQPLSSSAFRAHPGIVNSVAFSSDGTRIVTGGDDNSVKVWDATSFAPLGSTFQGHSGSVSSVAFTRGDTRIVSGSLDGTVHIWNAIFGLTIPADQGAIRTVGFSSDNRTVASGGADGTVKLWDSKTATLKARFGEPSAPGDMSRTINSLAFYPGGNRIVTASIEGRVVVWDLASGGETKLDMVTPPGGLPMPNPWVQSVAVDRDGKYIAAGGFDGLVRLWDARTLVPIAAMPAETKPAKGPSLPYQVRSVAFSPDGHRLVTGSGFDKSLTPTNILQVWNVDTRTPDGEPMQGQAATAVWALAFTSTGQEVISGSSDGTVRVWDVNQRKEIPKPLFGDQNPVYSLAAANHARWIAAGGGGGTVRVWDLASIPPEDTPLKRHQDWVQGVAISPDDTLIVSGSADGNLQLWPAPGDVGEVVCSKLTSNVSHKQWDEWVQSKTPYAELCPNLQVAPDA